MTIEQLLCYGKEHIHSDLTKMLLGELLNINTLELYNHLEDTIEDDKVELYKNEIEAIENGKPIQYVLGNVNFYGINYIVNENTLIPRFETEELVENTVNYAKQLFNKELDIIDLGTGTGAIGLTLEQKLPVHKLDLVDISDKALEVTKINHDRLNSRANLIQSDMWENVEGKYDIIISNPPYIKTNEEIEDIVKDNEPHLALYAGDDGLDCYKKIFESINEHTNDKCLIALEIGYTQAEDIKKIILENMTNVRIEVKKDMSLKDRMIFVFKNFE